jgi:aconitate hydratase
MGQAPAVGHNSLRTFPRNFPGRSGTKEDSVFLCSPETAAAAALTGVITDPRDLGEKLDMDYPTLALPDHASVNTSMLHPPPPPEEAEKQKIVKGPNISSLPELDPLPDELSVPVLLKAEDNISTDEISPAGRALPYRSNIPQLAEFSFTQLDETYPRRAREQRDGGGWHAVVGGENYGQGSSREHAAIAPRYLGLRLVIAKSFARIHWQNLANFGVLAASFENPADYDRVDAGDTLEVDGLRKTIQDGNTFTVRNTSKGEEYTLRHELSQRQLDDVLAGSRITRVAGAERSAQ